MTTLEESARRAGSHRWTELRLYEILGQWVASTSAPDAKLLFDRHSQHHAWRAAQWWERLPVLADVDRDSLTAPAYPELVAAFEQLAGFGSPVGRLVGTYRVVLPRLLVHYRDHLDVAGPVSDSSTRRTLEMLIRDLSGDWLEGEQVLQQTLTAETVGEAAAALSELESALSARS